MLTYSFENRRDDFLYECLYKQIKKDIKTNKIKQGEKLPSKRALAKHLDISIITVENAYGQLVAEGYIYSVARSGFYVSEIPLANIGVIYNDLNESENTKSDNLNCNNSENIQNYFIDFVSNSSYK